MHLRPPRFLAAFRPPRRLIGLAASVALLATLAHLHSATTEAAHDLGRNSCEAIAGADHESSFERLWFWKHCVAPSAPPPTVTPTPTLTPAPTHTPPPMPTPSPTLTPAPSSAALSTGIAVLDQFAAGYRWAGGPEAYLTHVLHNVIPCESNSNPYAVNYAGPYYGLMQFAPATWYTAGGGDWFSPWQQGANTANLLSWSAPHTQWPHCW